MQYGKEKFNMKDECEEVKQLKDFTVGAVSCIEAKDDLYKVIIKIMECNECEKKERKKEEANIEEEKLEEEPFERETIKVEQIDGYADKSTYDEASGRRFIPIKVALPMKFYLPNYFSSEDFDRFYRDLDVSKEQL